MSHLAVMLVWLISTLQCRSSSLYHLGYAP
jgi:hypothetical protein